jgi:CRP-like cAMP-binding protein
MGTCNCKDSNLGKTEVDVENIDSVLKKTKSPNNGTLIKVKSIKVKEEIETVQKLSEILDACDNDKIECVKTAYDTKKKEDSIVMEYEMNEKEQELIRNSLKKHFLFKDMNDDLLKIILNDIIEFRLEKKQTLFKDGDEGNFFYIVKSGSLEMSIKGDKKKTFNDWDCFGELALLQRSRRTGTVICLTPCKLYLIDGAVFRDIITKSNANKLKDKLAFIELIPIIRYLDTTQKNNLAESINQVEFSDKEKIICEGDIGENMYIIKEGIVSCRNKTKEIRKLYAKDYFGQNALFTEGRRTLDVVSIGRTICFEFTTKDFKEALGDSYKEIILHSIYMNHVTNNKFMSETFTELQLDDLFNVFNLKVYKTDDIVYSSNCKLNKKLLIIIDGNLVNVSYINIVQIW